MELRSEPATVEYRGETISYEKAFYHCVDSSLEFVDEELEAANLKLIYDKYRLRHSIHFAEELKTMRERYGIPSSAMSVILGLGENQFGLYEEGVVPVPSVGKLLALAMEPSIFREMLQSARCAFTDKQYRKYFHAVSSSMQPAKYETEDIGLMDYGSFPPFPSASIGLKPRMSSYKRLSYKDCNYVPAF